MIRRLEFRTTIYMYLYDITVAPLCVPTLAKGHPIINKATISERKLCMIVSNLPLTRGHSSYKAMFSIHQRWPHKKGATVHLYDCTNTHVHIMYTQLTHIRLLRTYMST